MFFQKISSSSCWFLLQFTWLIICGAVNMPSGEVENLEYLLQTGLSICILSKSRMISDTSLFIWYSHIFSQPFSFFKIFCQLFVSVKYLVLIRSNYLYNLRNAWSFKSHIHTWSHYICCLLQPQYPLAI